MPHFLFAALFGSLVLSQSAFAQAGSLDASFATAGQYVEDFGAQDNLTKVRVQPADQKIVAVGTALSPGFAGQLLVVRLLPDGTPDTSFNGTGTLVVTAFTESYAYDLYFQPDGKIVVVGARADINYQFSMLVMRLNEDGTLDTSFGTNGYSEPEISTADDFAYAVAPLPGGQLLLAGAALDATFRNQPVVVRMNDDGTVDASFGAAGVASLPVSELDNQFSAIGLQSDGSIVAAGHMDRGLTAGGQTDFDVLVARFSSGGVLDGTFGTGGIVLKPVSAELVEKALSMVVHPSDTITICGYTTNTDFSFDGILLRFDANGDDATNFGNGGLVRFDNAVQDVFYGIALQPDGKVVACGTSGGFFFDPRDQLVARYTASGTLDNAFDTDGFALNSVMGNFDEANAITLQADGKVVTAGKANTGTNNDVTVFRYLNDLNTMIGEERVENELAVHPNPVRAGGTVMLALGGSNVGDASLRLFDARGTELRINDRPTPMRSGHMVELPAGMAPGIYSIHASTADGRRYAVRLVVQD